MRIAYALWIVSLLGTSIVRQFVVINIVWRNYLEKKFVGHPKKQLYHYLTRFVVFMLSG